MSLGFAMLDKQIKRPDQFITAAEISTCIAIKKKRKRTISGIFSYCMIWRIEPMKEIIVSGYAYPSINPAVLEAWLPDLTFKYI